MNSTEKLPEDLQGRVAEVGHAAELMFQAAAYSSDKQLVTLLVNQAAAIMGISSWLIPTARKLYGAWNSFLRKNPKPTLQQMGDFVEQLRARFRVSHRVLTPVRRRPRRPPVALTVPPHVLKALPHRPRRDPLCLLRRIDEARKYPRPVRVDMMERLRNLKFSPEVVKAMHAAVYVQS